MLMICHCTSTCKHHQDYQKFQDNINTSQNRYNHFNVSTNLEEDILFIIHCCQSVHGQVYEQVCLCVLLTSDLMWSKHMYTEAARTLDIGCLQTTTIYLEICSIANYIRLVAMFLLLLTTVYLSVPSCWDNIILLQFKQYNIDCNSNASQVYLFRSCMSADNYTSNIYKNTLKALTTLNSFSCNLKNGSLHSQ